MILRKVSYLLYAIVGILMLILGLNFLTYFPASGAMNFFIPISLLSDVIVATFPYSVKTAIFAIFGIYVTIIGVANLSTLVVMLFKKDKKRSHILNIIFGALATSWFAVIAAVFGLLGWIDKENN